MRLKSHQLFGFMSVSDRAWNRTKIKSLGNFYSIR